MGRHFVVRDFAGREVETPVTASLSDDEVFAELETAMKITHEGIILSRLRDGEEIASVQKLWTELEEEMLGLFEDDEYVDDDSEWREEMAREAGMGLGVDAYNDTMGYGTSPEEE